VDVYINYPNPHFTIHDNSQCSQIQKHHKANQRTISVTNQNLRQVLTGFISNQYEFSSTASQNDIWLEVNLSSRQQNIGFVFVIQAILGMQSQPLSNAPVTFHC